MSITIFYKGGKIMKKRWIRVLATILSVAMVMGLCSCGIGEGNSGKSDKTVVTMSYYNSESTMRPLLDLL